MMMRIERVIVKLNSNLQCYSQVYGITVWHTYLQKDPYQLQK